MSLLKKSRQNGINPSIETRDLGDIETPTGNIYEGIRIVSKRAKQISSNLKEELHAKLKEFASTTDNLEEVFENREQIEISRFYEKMPHPVLLALREFYDDETYHRYTDNEMPTEGKK